MKEDSRKYAWVALLAIGLLVAAGGAFLFFGGSTGSMLGSSGLTPVGSPVKAPAPSVEISLEEPDGGENSVERRVTAGGVSASEEGLSRTANKDVLSLSVRHADGTPAHGALCALIAERQLLDLGECDAKGMCGLSGRGSPGELHVLGVTIPRFQVELEACRGEVEISLPEGAVISGVLLVDGVPPAERSFVSASSWGDIPEFLEDNLRWQARMAERESSDSQLVAADGSFLFSGVPEDWAGDLEVSRELWLEDGSGGLRLKQPREGIVLRATRRPRIRGRVLMPDGETPASFAIARIVLSWEGWEANSWTDAADADGVFQFGIEGGVIEEGDDEPAERAQIAFYDFERKGFVQLEFDLEPYLGKDLGDIVLEAARDIPFQAIDHATGVPVPGALAFSGTNRAELTDEEGRSVLRGLRPDQFEFQLLSIAHARTAVPVPARGVDEIVVRLLGATTLEVVVTSPDGSPIADLDLSLKASCLLFGEDEPTQPSSEHIELGASDSGNTMIMRSRDGDSRVETSFETDALGRCLLVGINPECAFTITAYDLLHHPLYAEKDIHLRRGQHRRIDIVSSQSPRAFRGVVRDEMGNAIPEARVFARSSEIQREGGSGAMGRRPLDDPDYFEGEGRSTTDAEGAWEFKDLLSPAIDLMVVAEGFETLVLKDLQVMPDKRSPLELTLRRPRSLEIQVRAGEESLTDREFSLSAYIDGWRVRELSHKEGRWVIASPPDHELVLRGYCAQREFHKVVLPTDSKVDWELPALGTVELTWNFEAPHRGSRRLQLAPVGDADSTIAAWLRKGRDEAAGTRTLRAFPGRYEALMMGRFDEEGDMTEITTRVPITVEAGPDAVPQTVELTRN